MARNIFDFNVNTIEQEWEQAGTDLKNALLKQAADLPPSQGIPVVLAGLKFHHFSIRNAARETFEALKSKMSDLFEKADPQTFQDTLKESACFASKIYYEINTNASLGDLSTYFKSLLEIRGQGPYFAFKLLYKGDISPSVLKKIITMVPDEGKLAFVDQYIQTKPSIRIKYGFDFKNILRSVTSRNAVVSFYAYLFDMKRDADPFLNNIPFSLRDPEALMENELVSKKAAVRIMAVKALSMLTPRIEISILSELITHDPEPSVRMAVYHTIEDASKGVYRPVEGILTRQVMTREKPEALCAFRALVVCCSDPLHVILDKIRKNRSDLMDSILEEISALSRLSFFFIQDLALHKDQYLYHHFDINMALVLGMIKKRPERMVKVFKYHDDSSTDSLRIEIIDFIEKTKDLLANEKVNIESEFDVFVQRLKKRLSAKKTGAANVFPTEAGLNLKTLFKRKRSQANPFDREVIIDQDLSGQEFYNQTIFFNERSIVNCSFENCRIYNGYFKKTIFCNVNLTGARFESVCFDNAAFINVTAEDAVFVDCSFQEAAMYNCNFNRAGLVDACFAGSVLTKNSFIDTDFSYAVFSHARISAVSFIHANLNQADFTGVKARFSRFPSSSDALFRSDYIDYNARRFQMEITDLPRLNTELAAEINLLLFMEFFPYGEQKFMKQNKLSLLTCFDIFKPKQADLFEIMPILLHENIEFVGSGPIDPRTPTGISGYLPSIETQKRAARYLGESAIIVRRHDQPYIEGLFTIGSTGSLAQTVHSDIDYWVCVDEQQFTATEIGLLKQKLMKLETWAREEFGTKVTFFIVDIVKARLNDFGDSTLESSGSAQSRILKEEFYRTMIYVAGKIPLWSVLPNSISVNYYDTIVRRLTSGKQEGRYIDLGDIHAISSKEYFGASIWQMFKWLQSPFKSVLKMALLEKYLYEYGKKPLLCNKYKDEWMNSGAHLRLAQNDSYIILLENLLDYFEKNTDSVSKNIILSCFFLKLGISRDSDIENTVFGLRKILLKRCMDKWGWDKERIFEIGSFRQWQYRNIVRLSNTIKQYMVKEYYKINQTIDRHSQESSAISAEDRTILSRKIFIEFSKQPYKVTKELLVTRSDSYFQGLYLQYQAAAGKKGYWALLNRATRGKDEFLIQADTIEEIGAWLINNKLFTKSTLVGMAPNTTQVTVTDIKKLYTAMFNFYSPILNTIKSFDVLLRPKTIDHLFVSINFYSAQSEQRVMHYAAVYVNSWGEMFCQSVGTGTGFNSMADFKTDLKTRLQVEALPGNATYYFSKRLLR